MVPVTSPSLRARDVPAKTPYDEEGNGGSRRRTQVGSGRLSFRNNDRTSRQTPRSNRGPILDFTYRAFRLVSRSNSGEVGVKEQNFGVFWRVTRDT